MTHYLQEMANEFMERLLKTFKPDDPTHRSAIVDGAAAWISHKDDLDHFYKKDKKGKILKDKKEVDIVRYYAFFCQGSHAIIQPFALWALNILKNFFSNSRLEHGFSILTMFKSKYRGLLSDDKLRVPLVMSTEPDFGHVPFDALWKELFAYSQKKKTQHNVTTKQLRGKKK